VVLAGRSPAKLDETRDTIRAEVPQADLEELEVDLADLESVRRAGEAAASYGPLDVLVNNAGVMGTSRQVTGDGLDLQLATNHFGPFLFTGLLLPQLVASRDARVVTVSSNMHRVACSAPLGDPRQPHQGLYRRWQVYGQSKLANLLFTYELARRLEGSGVTVNAVHPGAVATGLGKNNGAFARALVRLLAPFFRTPAAGAATSLHLATSPEVEGVTGRYFASCREAHSSRASHDEEAAVRLWELSARLTDLPARVASAPADR
jgi:NAD(P)-dependent dehydrogenase (short-subunit alcohol dehydrogenase family)